MKKSSLFIISLLLLSCGEVGRSFSDTFQPSPQPAETSGTSQQAELADAFAPPQRISAAASPDALQEAENKLRALPRFAGKEIMIFRSTHFYDDGRIMLSIQDPEDHTIIDSYTYKDGAWQDPEPVRITRADRVDEYLAPLSQAPFIHAHKVYQTIKEKLKEIQSKDTSMTIYFVPMRGEIRWYPSTLSTDRSRYSLKFDEQGNLLSFTQD